ncbi:hypothetical protein B0H13DRAFT_1932569 [Mycena leptocephala]|nr:hypothetical protein B0H13DRAFT_1932569 [Mycena leptocephala]
MSDPHVFQLVDQLTQWKGGPPHARMRSAHDDARPVYPARRQTHPPVLPAAFLAYTPLSPVLHTSPIQKPIPPIAAVLGTHRDILGWEHGKMCVGHRGPGSSRAVHAVDGLRLFVWQNAAINATDHATDPINPISQILFGCSRQYTSEMEMFVPQLQAMMNLLNSTEQISPRGRRD